MIMENLGIYKCGETVIESFSETDCEISCCDKPMELLAAKTEDEGKEKHVPVTEKIDGGIKVKIGANPHPMEEDHFIQWIEVINGKDVYRHLFSPGDEPEAVFHIEDPSDIIVRELCNKHGLWKK